MFGRRPDVEVHVDVDVERARQFEDTADLARAILVVARRAADQRYG
jgi:hypothetical protein